MNKQTICEKERLRIEKLNKFQLSNKYKKVGFFVVFGSFLLMISKIFFDEPFWVKPVLSVMLLVGLLIVSLSKDKIEDEFIDSLRSQSYRLAFILAIVYSLVQPLINYGVGYLFDKNETLKPFGYFQILFFMLIVQLLFFWKLKRFNK